MRLTALRKVFPVPSNARFAELVLRELERGGVPRSAVRYEPEDFRLVRDDRFDFLGNIYRLYCLQWPWRRRRTLRQYVERILVPPTPERPSFADARDRLLPNLRDSFLAETVRLDAAQSGKPHARMVFKRFTRRLNLHLYVDSAEQMAPLTDGDLEAWGKSWDELYAIAVPNLVARSAQPLQAVAPGVYVSTWGDCYDPGRLLLPEVLRPLDLGGDPVAITPSWGALIVTGDRDERCLEAALRFAERMHDEHPRPISMLPIVRRGTVWSDLELPIGHPCHRTLLELRVKELAGIYEEQRAMLERLHATTGEDLHVAKYFGTRNDDGEYSSYCVWSKGVVSILPETERVAFFDPDLPEGSQILGQFDWSIVRLRAGHLLEMTADVPPRYRVLGFPEPEIIQSLPKLA